MRARYSIVVILALAGASVPGRSHAQSASAQAQSLFDDGRRLVKAGKLAEACTAFEASQKLDPAITTLLNLADCREANRQLATAWGLFVDANRLARAAGNAKLGRVATNHFQKLAPRLSKLTISVPASRKVAGLEILRDGEPVDAAGWNHALPIDGGTYTISARAPGYATFTATRTIKIEGDAQTIEIPALVPAKPPAVARTPRPGEPKPSAGPTTERASSTTTGTVALQASPGGERRGRSTLVPIVVGAGAVVLGGAALGFELSGRSKYDDAKAIDDDQARRNSLEDAANTRRYVAQALGVAAIGTAGVAVYLYVRGRGERRPATAAVTPVASPQLTGLAVVGSW